MCKEILALILLSCLMSFTRSQVRMDSCSINCDSRNVLGQPEVMDRIIKGRPGKRGPMGDVGPKGDKGEPAEQRECNELAGVLQQLQDLQRELNKTNHNMQALNGRMENLSNETGRNQQSTMRLMSALHPTLFYYTEDGHVYIKTNTKQSWSASRTICQDFGGDLAVVAFKQSNEREKLGQQFTAKPDNYGVWVGLTDAVQEGIWKWVDGSNATSTEIQWSTGQPDSSGNQDCGQLWGKENEYRMDDYACGGSRPALCEIRPLE